MKTFIAALIILAMLCTFVCGISYFAHKRISTLVRFVCALPASTESFFCEEHLAARAEEFCTLWAESMEFFTYIMGYDMLDRADDAALALCAAAKARCAEDFISARLRFLDAMGRIQMLFSLSTESIA